LYSKERALALLPFYSDQTGYDSWVRCGWRNTVAFIAAGLICIIMGMIEDVGMLVTFGGVFVAVGVVALLIWGGCWGCKWAERRRLENELTSAGQGPVVRQTLLQGAL
jgi:hypothetical protein